MLFRSEYHAALTANKPAPDISQINDIRLEEIRASLRAEDHNQQAQALARQMANIERLAASVSRTV